MRTYIVTAYEQAKLDPPREAFSPVRERNALGEEVLTRESAQELLGVLPDCDPSMVPHQLEEFKRRRDALHRQCHPDKVRQTYQDAPDLTQIEAALSAQFELVNKAYTAMQAHFTTPKELFLARWREQAKTRGWDTAYQHQPPLWDQFLDQRGVAMACSTASECRNLMDFYTETPEIYQLLTYDRIFYCSFAGNRISDIFSNLLTAYCDYTQKNSAFSPAAATYVQNWTLQEKVYLCLWADQNYSKSSLFTPKEESPFLELIYQRKFERVHDIIKANIANTISMNQALWRITPTLRLYASDGPLVTYVQQIHDRIIKPLEKRRRRLLQRLAKACGEPNANIDDDNEVARLLALKPATDRLRLRIEQLGHLLEGGISKEQREIDLLRPMQARYLKKLGKKRVDRHKEQDPWLVKDPAEMTADEREKWWRCDSSEVFNWEKLATFRANIPAKAARVALTKEAHQGNIVGLRQLLLNFIQDLDEAAIMAESRRRCDIKKDKVRINPKNPRSRWREVDYEVPPAIEAHFNKLRAGIMDSGRYFKETPHIKGHRNCSGAIGKFVLAMIAAIPFPLFLSSRYRRAWCRLFHNKTELAVTDSQQALQNIDKELGSVANETIESLGMKRPGPG